VLASKGFPPGILHTTLVGGGASDAAATTFKTDELALLAQDKMLRPPYVIGNTNTDADAYNDAGIMPLANRILPLACPGKAPNRIDNRLSSASIG
jgi:hypothetical protein